MSGVRDGWQSFEIGVIPGDWKVTALGRIMDFKNGFNAEKTAYGSGIPFVNVLEVITKSHLKVGDIPGIVYVPPSQRRAFEVRRGDILFNRTSETQEEIALAAAYVDDEPVIFGGFVIRGRPDQSQLDGQYAGYGLRAFTVRTQMIAIGQGAVRANVGQADLRKVLAPLPPKHEQQAIAKTLGHVDDLITYLEALIAKKRDIKLGAMQELLTGQRRLPEFEGQWTQTKLSRIGHFAKGSGVKKDEAASGELLCVRYGELYTHHHDIIRFFNSHISAEVAKAAYRLKCGDVLFAGSGETKEEIGKCAALIDDVEAYAGGDIIVFRPFDADPTFLGYFLNMPTIQRQKASKGQGDAVVHISAASLADIDIRIPRSSEQSAIAAILMEMDTEIIALERKLAKTHSLKQGMMQVLLTGEVRLV